MNKVIIDARTGETTIVEVPDEEMPIMEPQPPTIEDRVDALEDALLFII